MNHNSVEVGSKNANAVERNEHLNQYQLSKRWNISQRTLERWRWLGTGIPYIKIGNRVVYRFDDVLSFEQKNMRRVDGE